MLVLAVLLPAALLPALPAAAERFVRPAWEMPPPLPATALQRLLTAAGIDDVAMTGVEPAEAGQTAWRTQGLLGGAREHAAPAGRAFAELLLADLELQQQRCHGAMETRIELPRTLKRLQLAAATVTCTAAPRHAVGLVYYQSGATFAALYHEGASGRMAQVRDLQRRLYRTLLAVGQA